MLLCQALIKFLQLWDNHEIPEVPSSLVNRSFLILISCADKIRSIHTSGQSLEMEERAYLLLTLKMILQLPIPDTVQEELTEIVLVQRGYLEKELKVPSEPSRIWVEKISYGSPILARCYCIAALYRHDDKVPWKSEMLHRITSTSSEVRQMISLLPSFKLPRWKLGMAILQGNTYIAALKEARGRIFPVRPGVKDRFLSYIPCTWIVPSHVRGKNLDWGLLWDMMDISLSDFLIDEYMETKIASLDESEIDSVESYLVKNLEQPAFSSDLNGTSKKNKAAQINGHADTVSSEVREVQEVLDKYVRSIRDHPDVVTASRRDRETLREELLEFLLAHIAQLRDSKAFAQTPTTELGRKIFGSKNQLYHSWVNTTAAKHTSCHLSFAFMACVLSSRHANGQECFPSARISYLARDLCQQLAVLSRMYNDWASVARDRAEDNLNSINFLEFNENSDNTARQELYSLAEWTRRCATDTLEALKNAMQEAKVNTAIIDGLTSFSETTILYAEMYVVKDLTSRAKASNGTQNGVKS